jgi:uncharacterized protein (TIGR02646 family)
MPLIWSLQGIFLVLLMQQIPPIVLKNGLQQHLKQAQAKIDQLPSYYKKVKQAKVLWLGKKKTNAQKAAFNRIEKALQVHNHFCHYCEGKAGNSIDHFYPRGFYPDLTFVWENYLWSCQACNTQYKGAQFAIFQASDSAQVVPLVKDRSFVPPANQDALCLNPRVDDPLDYWHLNLETGHYIIKKTNSLRNQARAQYTLDLLQLNQRSALVKGRKEAYQRYWRLLEICEKVQTNPTIDYLQTLLPPKPLSFYKQSIPQQKKLTYDYLYQQFMLLPYNSVWRSMQQQKDNIPKLKMLFEQVPFVLDWR